jgi:hypothetical protein
MEANAEAGPKADPEADLEDAGRDDEAKTPANDGSGSRPSTWGGLGAQARFIF